MKRKNRRYKNRHSPLWHSTEDQSKKGEADKLPVDKAPHEEVKAQQNAINKEIALSRRSWQEWGMNGSMRLSDSIRHDNHQRAMNKTKMLQSITRDKPVLQRDTPTRLAAPVDPPTQPKNSAVTLLEKAYPRLRILNNKIRDMQGTVKSVKHSKNVFTIVFTSPSLTQSDVIATEIAKRHAYRVLSHNIVHPESTMEIEFK